MCVCVCTCSDNRPCGSQSPQEWVLFFHLRVLGIKLRLGDEHFYPLNYLTSTIFFFFFFLMIYRFFFLQIFKNLLLFGYLSYNIYIWGGVMDPKQGLAMLVTNPRPFCFSLLNFVITGRYYHVWQYIVLFNKLFHKILNSK